MTTPLTPLSKQSKKKTNVTMRSPLCREESSVSSELPVGCKSTGSSKRFESFREENLNEIAIEES